MSMISSINKIEGVLLGSKPDCEPLPDYPLPYTVLDYIFNKVERQRLVCHVEAFRSISYLKYLGTVT